MNELHELLESPEEEKEEHTVTIEKCKSLLQTAMDYWSAPHDAFQKDIAFANGEQWDETVKTMRLRMYRDCQTYNIVPGFIRPLTNAIKECPPGITIYPDGTGANKDQAKALSGVIRSIEYRSNAGRAYTHALESSAEGGLGAWRVLPKAVKRIQSGSRTVQAIVPTPYGERIVDQQERFRELVEKTEITIEQIDNPTCVYFDPTAKLPDYSDAGYVIYKNTLSVKDYRNLYPLGNAADKASEEVVVYELWRIGEEGYIEFIVFDEFDVLKNDATELTILPFVLITGKKIEINGQVEYISATKDIKACQKEINWLKSEAIASISSAPKSLWMAEAGSLENEDAWAESAINPDAILYHKKGTMPQPIVPPGPPVGYMELANANIEMARQISGIYPDPSTQQALSNASGKAIKYQQASSNIQTYHFIEALNYGIKRTGEILLDMISVYYSDDEVRMAMGVDNTFSPVSIGPTDVPGVENVDVSAGSFGVVISSGPSYSTQKEALMDQLLEMGKTNQQILPLIADVIVKNINLPGSEEIGDRFKVMMPPPVQELLKSQEGQNNNPSDVIRNQSIALQQQGQQMEQMKLHLEALAKALEKATEANDLKAIEIEQKKQINDDNIKAKMAMQEADHSQQDQITLLNKKFDLLLAKLNMNHSAEVENMRSLNRVSEHRETYSGKSSNET